jgi:hypothetical protein
LPCGGADRRRREDRGGRGDAHHHLTAPDSLAEYQAAADKADARDGPGQRVRCPVRGDDAHGARTGADQAEHAVTRRRASQVTLEPERVGKADGDREVTSVRSAHCQGHDQEPNGPPPHDNVGHRTERTPHAFNARTAATDHSGPRGERSRSLNAPHSSTDHSGPPRRAKRAEHWFSARHTYDRPQRPPRRAKGAEHWF